MKKVIIIASSLIVVILLFFLGINFLGGNPIEKANEYVSKVEEKISEEGIINGICIIQNDGSLICEDKTIDVNSNIASSGSIVIIDGKISNVDITVDNKNLININNEIVINNKKNEEKIVKGDSSGAEIPKLYTNKLIPVIYNGTNWQVADTSIEWYDYDKQNWANAVILKPGITKEVNDIVNVDNEIQGMFVWIPRFEYKIDGVYGKKTDDEVSQEYPGIIDINFISKNTSVATKGYTVHPAFTFNNRELSGIWASKFNTSADKESECYNVDLNMSSEDIANNYDNILTKCNNESIKPYVIPNARSLRFQNAHNEYITAIKMGLYVSNMDSHMSKNSEFTSIIYLSQSKYGKYGNDSYVGNDKYVKYNNNSNYLTGCGNNSLSSSLSNECSEFVTSYGMEASTTGNITGVYDMFSAASKRVMGFLETDLEIETTNDYTSAGFIKNPNNIYADIFKLNENVTNYDIYNELEINTYMTNICSNDRCKGQGLDEFYRWEEPESSHTFNFPTIENPWIIRGSYSQFHFMADRGIAESNVTFRITLIDNQ